MQAKDVMTREVATVRPETPLVEAATILVARHISGLPVLDESGQLVGILTEGDLLRRIELGTLPQRTRWLNLLRGPGLAAAEYVRTRTQHVEDVMTPSPASVAPEAPLEEVVALMERKRIKRVPVVDADKLVGVVSRSDLVRALVRAMPTRDGKPRDDAAIRADILAELEAQDWYRMCNITVTVEHGDVRLEGVVQSDAVHPALRVAVERVPGVVAVQNHVATMDPIVTVGV